MKEANYSLKAHKDIIFHRISNAMVKWWHINWSLKNYSLSTQFEESTCELGTDTPFTVNRLKLNLNTKSKAPDFLESWDMKAVEPD